MEHGKFSPHTTYKLVIFDFDGTLAELNLPWERLKDEVRAFVTRESLNFSFTGFNTISGGYAALAELTDRKRATLLRRELLRGLKEYGLAADAIISRDDVTRLKPNKEGVEKMLAQFHTRDAVLIGDGTYDERAATTAGIDFIGIRSSSLRDATITYSTVNEALRTLLNGRKQ